MFHPVTGRIWKIDNGLSSGVVTGKELPGIKTTDTGRPYKEVVKSILLELVIRHGLSLDDEAHSNIKQLHTELLDAKSRHYACMQGMFRLAFGKYGDVIANNRFQEFLGRLEMIATHGKPVGLVYGDDYSRPMEEGFAQAEAEAQKEKQAA
ncbi:hypothetical protein KBD61_00265 [Patescibacteria group bacterium]|nr:hypothetical protein [Patescibacteria group bacterium]MBP9709444.1 hypothetical protein [Patescibacteria group bacterium]